MEKCSLWLLSCAAALAMLRAESLAATSGNSGTATSGNGGTPTTGNSGASSTSVEKFENSPWLLAPIVQSSPKLGSSLGALAGYIYYFDKKSRPSVFALQGQYSSTDSIVGGLFARTSFDEDRQRLIAGLLYGYVKNDYDDYLGTGVPLKADTDLRSAFTRYLYRVPRQLVYRSARRLPELRLYRGLCGGQRADRHFRGQALQVEWSGTCGLL